jgi:acetyltransferase-like isoleucine patch superfamily enzyme
MAKLLASIIFRMRLLLLELSAKELTVGSGFRCGKGCTISKKNTIIIGNNFFMGHYCHLAANTVIGNDVMFGSHVALVGGDHNIDGINVPMQQSGRAGMKTVHIEDNVWIGHGAIILHGVRIRTGAVVAAGAVVTKDVESNAVVGGNPAKLIRMRQ